VGTWTFELLDSVVDLLGAPGSILHDELLGSAGYPSADEWAAIDLKREELLRAALGQFASDNSALVEALLASLAKVRQLTTDGYAATHTPNPNDPFGYLNDRVSVQRVQIAGGIVGGERPTRCPPATDRLNEPSDARLHGEEGCRLDAGRRTGVPTSRTIGELMGNSE
jgi:hypothetical protein